MINKALKNVITLLLVVVLLISNMTSVCAVSDREVNSSKPKLSLPLNHEFSKDEVTILTKNGELTLDLNELRTTGKAVVLLERFLTLDETAYNFPVMVTSFSGAETVELNWLDNGETVEEEFNTEYESVVTLIKLWKSYYDESSADFIKEQLKIIANSKKSNIEKDEVIILTKNGELTLDLNELRTTEKAVVLLERFLTLDETAYNFPVMVTSFSGAETVELNWLDNGETVEEEFNTEYESVVTLIKLWKSYYDESSADFIKEQLKIIANSRKSKLNRQYLIQKD